jgi:alpha-galactosidase
MPKIVVIGAGGYVFPLRLIGDLLSFPSLQDSTLTLMDISDAGLQRTAAATRELVAHHGLPTRVEATTDRRAALDGANYVIITFQVGGIEAYRHDVEIPRRYGIDQTVGDTVGPGGVFRFLRSAPAYKAIASDMREVCPGALLINYANPMAMATWFLNDSGITTVGLCHSVQNTSRLLARELDVHYDEISFLVAGINHQAWFTEFRRGAEDLYPRLREVMAARHLDSESELPLADDFGDHSDTPRAASVYEGGHERVRTQLMRDFGYFHTESSHHASEYVPYFRKTPEMAASFIPNRWDYYEICAARDDEGHAQEMVDRMNDGIVRSMEYGAAIIDSMETGIPRVIHGNVMNRGLIENLPQGSCVEVPCLVDRSGVQPTAFGPLPPQCAAVNRSNIAVQELAVRAAMDGSCANVYQSVMLDPLTSAILTLDEIRSMVDELFVAHEPYLQSELGGSADRVSVASSAVEAPRHG